MDLENLADLFRALMHPTRLAILEMLRDDEECVCHMEAMLGLRQAHVSQHLSVLREAGLVDVRRDGWNVYYRVIRPEVFAVINSARRMLMSAGQERVTAAPPAPRPVACNCPKCNVRQAQPSTAINSDETPFKPVGLAG